MNNATEISSGDLNSRIFPRRAIFRRTAAAVPVLVVAASQSGNQRLDALELLADEDPLEATLATQVQADESQVRPSTHEPRYCLNTSTINGSQLPLREQLKIASEAGYDSVELWLRDIEKFMSEGGNLPDLQSEMSDLGLGLEGAIGFSQWIVEDPSARSSALDQFRREADLIRQLGGNRIAAPPAGATGLPKLDLDQAAERYRGLLETGEQFGVTAQLELWGFSANLSTLAEVLYVAAAAEHPNACLLLDIYHLYKGGSDFLNMSLVPAANMACLHMNDYPPEPDRQAIADKDRVFPGDGVAPLPEILSTFFQSGFAGALSLELFNRTYWEMPPEEVAKTGLEKMKQVVKSAKDLLA